MVRWLLILVVVLAAVAGLVLGALNADPVRLNLLVVAPTLPLGALVIVALAAGLLAGVLLTWLLFIVPASFHRSSPVKNRTRGTALTDRHDG